MRVPTLDFSVPPSEASGRPSGMLNKYTVPSILQEVDRASRALAAPDDALATAIISEPLRDLGDGTVIDMELVGLAPVSRERGVERRQQIQDLYARAFESEIVTLTFGLVEAWYDHETGRYIQETRPPALLKRFPGRFGFVMLDYQACAEQARRTIEVLNATGAPKKIIITTLRCRSRAVFPAWISWSPIASRNRRCGRCARRSSTNSTMSTTSQAMKW